MNYMLHSNIQTENILVARNTRPTSMRILVYNFLAKQHAAFSITEIEKHFQHADRITIYRTLKTFEEKGIIHSIQEDNITKYTLCGSACSEQTHYDQHLHFYCKSCKQTTCKTDIAIPLNNITGFKIDDITFFARGICEKCINPTLQ